MDEYKLRAEMRYGASNDSAANKAGIDALTWSGRDAVDRARNEINRERDEAKKKSAEAHAAAEKKSAESWKSWTSTYLTTPTTGTTSTNTESSEGSGALGGLVAVVVFAVIAWKIFVAAFVSILFIGGIILWCCMFMHREAPRARATGAFLLMALFGASAAVVFWSAGVSGIDLQFIRAPLETGQPGLDAITAATFAITVTPLIFAPLLGGLMERLGSVAHRLIQRTSEAGRLWRSLVAVLLLAATLTPLGAWCFWGLRGSADHGFMTILAGFWLGLLTFSWVRS